MIDVLCEVYGLKWECKIKYLPANGTLQVGGGAWPIRREARLRMSGLFTKSASVLLWCRATVDTRLCILFVVYFVLLFICLFGT